MMEWKANDWLFGVLVLFGVGVAFYLNREKHQTASYGRCKFDHVYHGILDTLDESYQSNQRDFGRCLCELYLVKPDSILGRLIVQQGIKYGVPVHPDSANANSYKSLDSLLKYRMEVFSPLILSE